MTKAGETRDLLLAYARAQDDLGKALSSLARLGTVLDAFGTALGLREPNPRDELEAIRKELLGMRRRKDALIVMGVLLGVTAATDFEAQTEEMLCDSEENMKSVQAAIRKLQRRRRLQ